MNKFLSFLSETQKSRKDLSLFAFRHGVTSPEYLKQKELHKEKVSALKSIAVEEEIFFTDWQTVL